MEESDPTCLEAYEKNCPGPGKEARRAGFTAFRASHSQIRSVWGIPSYYHCVLGIPRHPPGMYRSLVLVIPCKKKLVFRREIETVCVYAGKEILTKKRHSILQQPLLNKIFKEPPIISYRKGRSLEDILVRTKL